MQALRKIVIIAVSLVALGAGFIYYSYADPGYALVSMGGGAILTYAVVEVLLERERTHRWSGVQSQVTRLIEAELNAILTDAIFVSGADSIVFGYPADATQADFRRIALEAHLGQLRAMSGNLNALKANARVQYLSGGAGDLFADRAKIMGDLQGKYPFVGPAQLGLLIDLEASLRRLDTGVAVAKRYADADETNAFQVFERNSSLEVAYQELQEVLRILIGAIDQRTLVPTS